MIFEKSRKRIAELTDGVSFFLYFVLDLSVSAVFVLAKKGVVCLFISNYTDLVFWEDSSLWFM